MRRTYRDGSYGQIHIREARPSQASGVALLCFHMSPTSGRIYENFIAEMGRDRLCLAPDTPGFGASDPPPEPPAIDGYAHCFAKLLDSYQLQTVDLMGYHTGSKIAVELAFREPQRVRRVVLVSASVYTPTELRQARAWEGVA